MPALSAHSAAPAHLSDGGTIRPACPKPGSRVLVAMSGGVDSALAAIMLRQAGHEVVGVNMRTYHPTADDRAAGRKFQTCCSPEDAADARAVADVGDFPFYVLDLEKDFHEAVVRPFIDGYLNGLTPNPCVLCNNHLKLGVLLEKAHMWGCDHVATGHYARPAFNHATGRHELLTAVDGNKDQTYYLFGLDQTQLSKFLCPLGHLTKPEVRDLARAHGLVTVADKPESMEICFVPGNDYRAFLRARLADDAIRPGDIVTADGRVVGRHEGVACYTVGQRKGLGLSTPEPMYVMDVLPDENLVVVGRADETARGELICDRMNWIAVDPPGPGEPLRCAARIRHRHTPASCMVESLVGSISPSGPAARFRVTFDEPQRAIAPGQAVVLYDGERTLAGGWIVRP